MDAVLVLHRQSGKTDEQQLKHFIKLLNLFIMNTLCNSVKLIGRVGQDPEVRNLEKGNKVASFTLATNEVYTDKEGEKREITQWHNIVTWGGLATVVEKYLTKGKQVAIDGRIGYRNWEDKFGSKHVKTEITANELMMLGNKPKTE